MPNGRLRTAHSPITGASTGGLAVDGNQADSEDSSHARFFLRAPLLIATKPVLIGVTERLAPQLLHCMK